MTQNTAGGVATSGDGHRHLPMAAPESNRDGRDHARRFGVIASAAGAAALFAGSFFAPWWSFKLYAPQYPGGLTLVISLTGMGGDVTEIDLLNHYIGMAHLADAAPVERRLAGWGVAGICVITLALLAAAGRKLNRLVAVPAFAFPLVFLADSFGWLYRFGHHLSPKAPIKLGSFTPEMFGNGKIGQFETFAQPSYGFWLAVGGVALAFLATWLRRRVCASCTNRDNCSVVCPRLMVLPERKNVAAEGGAS